ncbi:hypothetical protein D9758_017559 [Tetrapyrgos nigripes]|uniref:Uncharacterized protein n=1 Tax=Tetrapyrgos nigripes TaxID=182062 RepID=A0A8H5FET1_9AGAR|nr:hypothetical protein D9758_017559 [Tetrapyrgos nigripes]
MASNITTPNLGPTLGAFELGVLFSTLLYGSVLVQGIYYFQNQFKDHAFLKMMVVFVLGLLWAGLYLNTIKGFADLEAVDNINWTIGLAVPIAGIVVLLALGIACAVTTRSFKFSAYTIDFRWLLIMVMTSGAVVDMANTAALILCLKKGWTPQYENWFDHWDGRLILAWPGSDNECKLLNRRTLLHNIHDHEKPSLNSIQGHIQFRVSVDTVTVPVQSHL